MSKRTQTVLICVLVVIASAMAFRVLNQREPRYEGKPLSTWLKEFDRWNGDTNMPVVQALRAMGDNAAPILARAILTKDSDLERNVMAKLELYLKLDLTTVTERSRRAANALFVMEEHASAAGPIFFEALTSDDEFVRQEALNGFASLGPQSEEYLPAIINLEQDPSLSVRCSLIAALGCIGRRPDLCKPVLLRAVEDRDSRMRHLAVVAFSKFDNERVPAITVARTNESMAHPTANSPQGIRPDD
jgi:HEAT repeat protein